MDIKTFLSKYEVMVTFIGTILAFTVTNFIESIERNLLRPFIRKYFRVTGQTRLGNVLSELLAVIIIMTTVYLIFKYTIENYLPENKSDGDNSAGNNSAGNNSAGNNSAGNNSAGNNSKNV